MTRCLALLSFAFALTLGAQTPSFTISPDRGPVAGGTVVTIKGQFGEWPYGVIFGSVHVPATRVNATTLTAITPPHLPGQYPVVVFEYDFGIETGLTFTFEGEAEGQFDRLLLPVFSRPVPGAFGSEFRSDLTVRLAGGEAVDLYGLQQRCPVTCIVPDDAPISLTAQNPQLQSDDLEPQGKPGRFVYLPKGQLDRVAVNLRAYDTSRAAENFGTEIPIVRADAFTSNCAEHITLVNVPSDPGFRNTLRIYGHAAPGANTDVIVQIQSDGVNTIHGLKLSGSGTLFDPYYAEFTNFPVGTGRMRVRLSNPVCPSIAPQVSYWAFISVTNNETQHITTITPQP